MRRCPNPGCPFHVRHGFAAEFNDAIERCRSCDAALPPEPEPEAQTSARATAIGPFAGRLAVSLILLVALVGFARVPVPGYEAFSELGVDTRFGGFALGSALAWLIGATIFVELGALVLPPARSLRASVEGRAQLRMIGLGLALAGLVAEAWWMHRSVLDLGFTLLAEPPSLLWMCLSATAVLPFLLAIAAANDRWGLGHGISLVVGGLVIHELSTMPTLTADPAQAVLVVVLIAGLAVWLARPTRASASGRTGREPQGQLGLGLTVPSCGLIPLAVLPLIPAAIMLALMVTQVDLALADLEALGAPRPDYPALWSLPPAAKLTIVVILAAALTWLFTRPKLLVERWTHAFPKADPAALHREADALFRRTALRSILLLVVLQLLTEFEFPAYAAAIAAALLVDLSAELRLRNRHPDVVAVEVPADVPGAEALAYALRLEHRPALIQAVHHRALYRLFGTWIPLRILVREQDQARAEQLRDAL